MGILDEAIKEHLELKRQHGAGDSELKKLEDEAFGLPERPGVEAGDAVAEAPTELVAQPEPAEDLPPRRRAPDIADLQEAPEPEPEVAVEEQAVADEPPAAAEPQPAGPTTEEREALAEHPTEMYDVEGEIEGSEPPAPSEEELVEAEIGEPRLAPVDPLAGAEDEDEEPEPAAKAEEPDEEEDDDFWDEKRLSDELDQALEAPEEDLLEETPDFLEEAPEDDQLWFEQKPPKDFNFDD
jgi:hypothetical protein